MSDDQEERQDIPSNISPATKVGGKRVATHSGSTSGEVARTSTTEALQPRPVDHLPKEDAKHFELNLKTEKQTASTYYPPPVTQVTIDRHPKNKGEGLSQPASTGHYH